MPPLTIREVSELADVLGPMLAEQYRKALAEQTRELKAESAAKTEELKRQYHEAHAPLVERVDKLEANQRKALVAYAAIVVAGTFIFNFAMDQFRAWWLHHHGGGGGGT